MVFVFNVPSGFKKENSLYASRNSLYNSLLGFTPKPSPGATAKPSHSVSHILRRYAPASRPIKGPLAIISSKDLSTFTSVSKYRPPS